MSNADRIEELRNKYEENPRRYFAPLANEFRKAGDLAQAIAICREHLPKQPGHMSGYIVYGQTLFESNSLDEARTVFEQALALDPENLIALKHLGDIARVKGENSVARRWYERVLDADPRNDEIAAQLAALSMPTPPLAMPAIAPPVPVALPAHDDEKNGVFRSFDPGALLDIPEDVISGNLPRSQWEPRPSAQPRPAPTHEPIDLDFPESPEPVAAQDAAQEFEEGLIAPEWPDTSDLVQRIVTPYRSTAPVSAPVTSETVAAFGREAHDERDASMPNSLMADVHLDDSLVEAYVPATAESAQTHARDESRAEAPQDNAVNDAQTAETSDGASLLPAEVVANAYCSDESSVSALAMHSGLIDIHGRNVDQPNAPTALQAAEQHAGAQSDNHPNGEQPMPSADALSGTLVDVGVDNRMSNASEMAEHPRFEIAHPLATQFEVDVVLAAALNNDASIDNDHTVARGANAVADVGDVGDRHLDFATGFDSFHTDSNQQAETNHVEPSGSAASAITDHIAGDDDPVATVADVADANGEHGADETNTAVAHSTQRDDENDAAVAHGEHVAADTESDGHSRRDTAGNTAHIDVTYWDAFGEPNETPVSAGVEAFADYAGQDFRTTEDLQPVVAEHAEFEPSSGSDEDFISAAFNDHPSHPLAQFTDSSESPMESTARRHVSDEESFAGINPEASDALFNEPDVTLVDDLEALTVHSAEPPHDAERSIESSFRSVDLLDQFVFSDQHEAIGETDQDQAVGAEMDATPAVASTADATMEGMADDIDNDADAELLVAAATAENVQEENRVSPDQSAAPSEATRARDDQSAFVTETMAELLVKQGFIVRAIEIYEELVRRRAYDPVLSSRLTELQSEEFQHTQARAATPARPTPLYGTPQRTTPIVTPALAEQPHSALLLDGAGRTGRTARQRFAELAGRRVSRRTPTHATAIADDAAEGLSSLFGSALPTTPDELAARALADAFGPAQDSGESLFDPPQHSAPSAPLRALTPRLNTSIRAGIASGASEARQDSAAKADYSFDRFFPDPAVTAKAAHTESTLQSALSVSQPANEDLAQFSAWLKGLNNA